MHNNFFPCLNLRKTYGNFGKSSEISANFRKLRKRFKSVFEELLNALKTIYETFGKLRKQFQSVFRWFYEFLLNRESSELFGNIRKTSENIGNVSKIIFRCFYDFFDFSECLRNSSEVFGNLRKLMEIFGNGSKVNFRCFYDFLKLFECNVIQCNTVIYYLFHKDFYE